MRFPDLLVQVQDLSNKIAVLDKDLSYLIAEIQGIRAALLGAFPGADMYFRNNLPVSRETIREVNDREDPTLF